MVAESLEPDLPPARFPPVEERLPWSRRIPGAIRSAWHGARRELLIRGWRSRRGLTLPGFLGIGTARAGTTWMYANLVRHPEVFLPRSKEVHYFDNRFQMPVEAYAEHFRDAGQRMAGDITPNYSILTPARIRVVRGLLPEARIFLMVRDPIHRAWSNLVMDFERIGGRRLEGVSEVEMLDYVRSDRSVRLGDYAAILGEWRRWFPADRILVLDYADVEGHPEEVFRRCLAHLGVRADVDLTGYPLHRRVLASVREWDMPLAIRRALLDIYLPRRESARAALGTLVDRWDTA